MPHRFNRLILQRLDETDANVGVETIRRLSPHVVEQVANDLLVGPRGLARYRQQGLKRADFPASVKAHTDIKDLWVAAQTFQASPTHLYLDARTGAWWASATKPMEPEALRAAVTQARSR